MDNATLITLTSDIVSAHVSNNSVTVNDLPTLIQSVYQALVSVDEPASAVEEKREPAVSARASVKPDAVTCMECGFKANLRQRTYKWTGIPVSIGVGPTKTLAKLANRLAKKSAKAGGVIDLTHHPAWIEPALRKTPIGDVWGIGRRWSQMLEERGIMNAYDFVHARDSWIRKKMGVVGLRTAHELRGHVCHAFDDQPQPKQTTCCSRSFGDTITDKTQVHDALMSFAERAAEKVRRADQVAGAMQVFVRTDPFNHNAAQKSLSGSVTFDHPTNDARAITGTATRILERIWREGFAWKKAGVLLLDLVAKGNAPLSLFDQVAPKDDGLMNAMDTINQRYGRGSIRLGLARKGSELAQVTMG